MTLDDHMHECWNGVANLFSDYSNTEIELYKSLFYYAFRRGAHIAVNEMTQEEQNDNH